MSVLLVQTAFVGDFVLTTPVLSALNSAFGRENVYVVARPFAKEIIKNRVLAFDKSKGKYYNLIRIIFALRGLKLSKAIVPHLSSTSAFISFISGAKERIGFEENPLSFLFTKRVKKFSGKVGKEADRIAKILEPLGIPPGKPELYVDDFFVEKWRRFLKPFEREKKIIFAPFSNWGTKTYPFWKELISDIPDGFVFILIGKKKVDSGFRLNAKVLDLLNKTSLKDVVALTYLSDVFLGVDNGISHIASALSKRCFVIFGPTIPEFGFFPNFSDYRVLQVDIPCRPCSLHGPDTCPRVHFACMKKLTPDIVKTEFLKFFSSS